MIEFEAVSLWYKNVQALDEVTVRFQPGSFYGLVGPNGAGKSSLLKILCGLISEYSGEVLVHGKNIRAQRQELKKHIGYAPEDPELMPYLTGFEFLQLIADIHKLEQKQPRITTLIEVLNLGDVKDELIQRYSHGMRQKISVAAALISQPKILLLDEALNGLDPISLYNTQQLLNEMVAAGATVILSSHILELLEDWAGYIVVLNKGKKLVEFSQEELHTLVTQKQMSFSAYFVQLIKSEK